MRPDRLKVPRCPYCRAAGSSREGRRARKTERDKAIKDELSGSPTVEDRMRE